MPIDQEAVHRRAQGLVLAIVLVGAALTLALFLQGRRAVLRDFHSDFQSEAQAQRANMASYLEARLQFLDGLARHMELDPEPGAKAFDRFVAAERSRVDGIQALEWAPRVTRDRRAAFEARGGLPITQRGPAGTLERAGVRQAYFPVTYLEPVAGNRLAMGFDLGSNRVRLTAIEAARDTGLPRATEPLLLVQETKEQPGFLIFAPVFHSGQPTATVAQRRAAFRGVVVGVFRTGDLIAAAVPASKGKSLMGALYDLSSGWRPGPIHTWGGPPAATISLPRRILLGSLPTMPFTLPFAGRTWAGRIQPQPAFVQATLQTYPWFVLPVGSVVTGLMAWLVFLLHTQKRRAEKLFMDRSRELVQSVAELGRREDDLRLLLDSTAEAIYGINLKGRCTFCNQALLKMLGYNSPEDLIGRNMHVVIHHSRNDGSEYPEHECRIFKAIRDGRESHADDEVIWRADGTSFPSEYWSYPQFRDGKLIGAVVTFNDISSRMAMAQGLADKDRLLGAVSRSLAGLLDSMDYDQVLGEFLALLGEGARASRAYLVQGFDGAHPVRTHQWVTAGTPATAVPFLEASVGAQGFPRWVEALRGDQTISGALEAFPVGERRFLEAEGIRSLLAMPVQVHGTLWAFIGLEECQGLRTWSQPEQDILRLAARALGTVIEHQHVHAEVEAARANLECRVAERTQALVQANEELEGEMASRRLAEDERNRAQTLLHQAQKLESIGRLAANIAHEINTPIQYLSVNLQFLDKTYAQLIGALPPFLPEASQDLHWITEETPKVLSDCMEGLDQVARIVRAMKEFSHPGSPDPVAMDLNRCLDSAVTVSRNEWKNVATLALDLAPELPVIHGFQGELNQVFLNLIVNAAQAIAAKTRHGGGMGAITVASRLTPGGVEIRVADTGTGIAPEHQGRVFDPFFTTKEVGVGTGQGLAVSYQTVVQQHGGSITFTTREGEGTTFIVLLPLRALPTQPRARWEEAV